LTTVPLVPASRSHWSIWWLNALLLSTHT
jgi:hypothetical protein